MKIRYKLIITFTLITILSTLPLSFIILNRQEKERIELLVRDGEAAVGILSRAILNILTINGGDIQTSRIDSMEFIKFMEPYEKNGLIYADVILISLKKDYNGILLAKYKNPSKQYSAIFNDERVSDETTDELIYQASFMEVYLPGTKGKHYRFTSTASLANSQPLCVGRLIFDESFIIEPINRLRKIILFTAAGVIASLAVVGIYLSRLISRPLSGLAGAVQGMENSDYAIDFRYDGNDEIGILSKSIGDLGKMIRLRVSELVAMNMRLIEMDRVKDEFLANITHELRTPLYGISGITETLLEGKSAGDRENLNLILTSSRRLGSMVNDILDFSKLKNHDLVMDRTSVSLRAVILHVLSILQPMIKKKGLAVNNWLAEDVYVWGDVNRLMQVMFNLIENAIKYTDSGTITVSAQHNTGSEDVTVVTEDTGIGIPAERLELIFEPFEQGGINASPRRGGTGLGLTISKKIIELMGGRIWAESSAGRGSRLQFTLKRSHEHPSSLNGLPSNWGNVIEDKASLYTTAIPDIHDETAGSDEAYGKLILIVDDEPVNLHILTGQLKLEGYRTISASSGKAAMEALAKRPAPDLALVDVMLPDISGYDLCRKIRENFYQHELPVLMITAKGLPGDIVMGFDAGASDYIIKPVNREELAARVKNLITLKESVINWNTLSKLNDELAIATEIQRSILPPSAPHHENIEIALRYIPAMAIGGDYFNFNVIDSMRMGVLIADAIGHGIPAAMMCSMMDVAFTFCKEFAMEPARLFEQINNIMSRYDYSNYFTAMYIYIDLEKKIMLMSNAGHKPLFIMKAGDKEAIPRHINGLPLGIFNDAVYGLMEIPLEDGDRIVLYTDGLTDIKIKKEVSDKTEILKTIIESGTGMTPGRLASKIIETLQNPGTITEKEHFFDDVTLIIMDINIPV